MNRLQFLFLTKNQYDIQSPFLFKLYSEVIAPPLDKSVRLKLNIDRHDHFTQLLYKLQDHFKATLLPTCDVFPGSDVVLTLHDDGLIALVNRPHGTKNREAFWNSLVNSQNTTLSVDLFHTGLLFNSPKLARKHILLRPF